MRRGPGHLVETHPGFPGTGPTLQDRSHLPSWAGTGLTSRPLCWAGGPVGVAGSFATAEGPEASAEERVFHEGPEGWLLSVQYLLCKGRSDFENSKKFYGEAMIHLGLESG